MSITFREVLGKVSINDIPIKHQQNIEDLLKKINVIRTAWGKPMTVTSGYRTLQDHLRVYSELAAKRGVPFERDKVPMGSQHLRGCAVDILDTDGSLHDWCVENTELLEEVGLWCEEKDDQKRTHFQSLPPKSGKRFFKP